MNKAVGAQWLADLRSGKYKQAYEVLAKNDCYCCLGVLADQYLESHNLGWDSFLDHRDEEGETLPSCVVEWAGLTYENPKILGRYLSEYNDDTQLNFSEIADLIEKHLL